MSIASDTQRIKSAKAAIQAAIEGKGVTVPDGTLLDGMAELIAGIEAGGNPFDINCTYGTFTPAEKLTPSSNPITIMHGLGNTIYSFLIFRTTASPKDIWGEIGFIGLIACNGTGLRTAVMK